MKSTGYVKSWDELAKLLGVSRGTLKNWAKLDGNPGRRADGRISIREWTTFAKMVGRSAVGPSAQGLKERLLEAQAKLVEHKLAVSKRLHVPVDEVDAIGARLGAGIRKVVCQLHLSAPDLENRSKEYVDQFLRAKEDEILAQLHAMAEEIGRMKEERVEDDKSESQIVIA